MWTAVTKNTPNFHPPPPLIFRIITSKPLTATEVTVFYFFVLFLNIWNFTGKYIDAKSSELTLDLLYSTKFQWRSTGFSYYSYLASKSASNPQWSLGKHWYPEIFCKPIRPKNLGTAEFNVAGRKKMRSKRQRGLNLPGNSLLVFLVVSHVHWHSFREPHASHRSYVRSGSPPTVAS